MKKVYIASPYTYGDQLENTQLQIKAANVLMNYGFAPFVPLFSHFQHELYPRPYQDWLDLDVTWLKTCDLMFRIRPVDASGNEIPSSGADLEEATAKENNIPVTSFKSVEDLDRYLQT